MLASFILAGYNDVRRQVRDTNRRIRLVDMLSARTAASIGIDSQIFRVNLNCNFIVDFRRDFKHRKRGLPFSCRVKRRNSDKPVHTFFVFQIAVGIFAFDKQSCAFDSGLRIILQIEHFYGVALLVAPSCIHSEQHGSPVHRVHAAGSRMNGKDCSAVVVFSRQKRLEPEFFQFFLHRLKIRLDALCGFRQTFRIRSGFFLHLGNLNHFFHVVESLFQLLVVFHGLLHGFLFLHHFLGIFKFLPKIRLFNLPVRSFQFVSYLCQVKESHRLQSAFREASESLF